MFGSVKKRFRAATFDMAIDDSRYEEIRQNVLDGEEGWSILEKRSFMDEQGSFYMYMEWTEPK